MKYKMKVVNVSSRLRVRSGPSLSYKILNWIYNGDTVIATEQKGNWFKHDKGGWSRGDYLKLVEDLEKKNVITKPKQEPVPPNTKPPTQYKEPANTVKAASNTNTAIKPQIKKENISKSVVDDIVQSTGWYNKASIDKFNKFNRFGYRDVYDTIRNTREYLFFTKPDLNIFANTQGTSLTSEAGSDSILYELAKRNPESLFQLQRYVNANKSPFMNLLSNTVKNTLDLPSISARDIETSSNQFGTKIQFRKHSFESDENHDFSLEFEDSKDLRVYALFKAWNRYSDLKTLGVIKPLDKYRDNMEMHDQISIFKIVVGENGEDILFFAKITGVYPKGAPREAFSEVGEKLVYNVPFKGQFVEDMDPLIIYEFNKLANQLGGNNLPLYNASKGQVEWKWANSPYIIKQNYRNKPGSVYKLKWRG